MKSLHRVFVATVLSAAGCLFVTAPPVQGSLVYSQDFNGFSSGTTDLGDGSSITSNTGTASVITDQGYTALRLTGETVANTTAEWTLPDLAPGAAITSFTASFDLLLYTAGGTPAADAFYFQFGNESSNLQDSRLGIGFITFQTNQIQIWNSGTQIGGSYGTPQVYIDTFSDKFRSTTISWNETDGLSLSYGGSSLATNLSIPGFDPVSGDVFSFYAWNGENAQSVYLDNVAIVAVPEPGSAMLASLALLGTAAFFWIGKRVSRFGGVSRG